MKKVTYNAVAYSKGNSGRKGVAKMIAKFECMSDAINNLQKWIYLHEDLYYYTIERKIIVENE